MMADRKAGPTELEYNGVETIRPDGTLFWKEEPLPSLQYLDEVGSQGIGTTKMPIVRCRLRLHRSNRMHPPR